MARIARTCSIPDCERKHEARGLCKTHYNQAHKRGELPPLPRLNTVERFWANVDKNGPVHPRLGSSCWVWTGTRGKEYGRFFDDGRLIQAHRVAYEHATGMYWPWLQHLQVDHRCHTKACVNPLHLRAANNKRNGEHRRGAAKSSKTGVRGVYRHKRSGRLMAQAKHDGRNHHCGPFDTVEEAAQAVVALRCRLFTYNDTDRRS